MRFLLSLIFFVTFLGLHAQTIDFTGVSDANQEGWNIASAGDEFLIAASEGNSISLIELDLNGNFVIRYDLFPSASFSDIEVTSLKAVNHSSNVYLLTGYYYDNLIAKSFYYLFEYNLNTPTELESSILEDNQSGIHLVILDGDYRTEAVEFTDPFVFAGFRTETSDLSAGKYPIMLFKESGSISCGRSFTQDGAYDYSLFNSVDINDIDNGNGYVYAVGGRFGEVGSYNPFYAMNDLGGCVDKAYLIEPGSSDYSRASFLDVEVVEKYNQENDPDFEVFFVGYNQALHGALTTRVFLSNPDAPSPRIYEKVNNDFALFDVSYNEQENRYFSNGFIENYTTGVNSLYHMDVNSAQSSYNEVVLANGLNSSYHFTAVTNSFSRPSSVAETSFISTSSTKYAYLLKTDVTDLRLDIFTDFNFGLNCDIAEKVTNQHNPKFNVDSIEASDFSVTETALSFEAIPDGDITGELCSTRGKRNSENSNELPISIEVYPNPSNGEVKVAIPNITSEFTSIQIIDAKGQTQFSQTYNTTEDDVLEVTLNLKEVCSPGIYILRTISGDDITTRRLVITK